MQPVYGFILPVIITISMTAYAKNYSAVESTRLRIKKLYRNHVLTRPSTQNISRTTVAIGLGIIEVAGLDPQRQVCINTYKEIFLHNRYGTQAVSVIRCCVKKFICET
jgi:hypothetical protein